MAQIRFQSAPLGDYFPSTMKELNSSRISILPASQVCWMDREAKKCKAREWMKW